MLLRGFFFCIYYFCQEINVLAIPDMDLGESVLQNQSLPEVDIRVSAEEREYHIAIPRNDIYSKNGESNGVVSTYYSACR